MARLLKAGSVDFAIADRWLSARLGPGGEGLAVLPLLNPRHRETVVSRRFSPWSGLAVVVARAVAEEGERLLKGALPPGASPERTDLAHYSIFTFPGLPADRVEDVPLLEWNGHVILGARSGGEE
jgi:hypothetical protein